MKTKAIQYIDDDALKRIIKKRAFQVDAGVAFSRFVLVKLIDAQSKARSKIHTIVFPTFSQTKRPWIRRVKQAELRERLKLASLAKVDEMALKELIQRTDPRI